MINTVTIRVTREAKRQVEEYARRYGLSLTQAASELIAAGVIKQAPPCQGGEESVELELKRLAEVAQSDAGSNTGTVAGSERGDTGDPNRAEAAGNTGTGSGTEQEPGTGDEDEGGIWW